MKRIYFLLAVLFFCFQNKTIAQNYFVGNILYQQYPTTGTVVPIGDDDNSNLINIGFPFTFYGQTYTQLVISANGYLSFPGGNLQGVPAGYSQWNVGAAIPTTSQPTNSILCPMRDLYPQIGNITYSTIGTAPNRKFVVSYDSVPMYSCTNLHYIVQTILHETSGDIDVQMTEIPICIGWDSGHALLGIQNIGGTNGVAYPGRNYPNVWSASHEGVRFTLYFTHLDTNLVYVAGKVFFDFNTNCNQDSGENSLPYKAVHINGPGANYYTYADANGNFSLVGDTGTYTITHSGYGIYHSFCPNPASYTFHAASYLDTFALNNFADTALHCYDLTINEQIGALHHCNHNHHSVLVSNNGTISSPVSTAFVDVPDSVYLLNATISYTVLGSNRYSFNIPSINPGQHYLFAYNDSTDCQLPFGSHHIIRDSISSGGIAECDSTNNSDVNVVIIINAWDPNDISFKSKDFYHDGYLKQDTIFDNDELTYRIRFQNTGNDTATLIEVIDTLPSYLDVSSVSPGASDHNYYFYATGNILHFVFPDVMLPDSGANQELSHGFVSFQVNQSPNSIPGIHILNQAAIYFDVNPAVFTNTSNIYKCAHSTNTISASICNGDAYSFNGQLLNSAGTYQHFTTNYLGCDSTVTLNLSVINHNLNVSQHSDTLFAISTGFVQWFDCSTNQLMSLGSVFVPTIPGNYYAISMHGSCSDTSSCFNVLTGIFSSENENIIISPNPVISEFEVTGLKTNSIMQLMDLSGKVLLNVPVREKTVVDISSFPQGIYFLKTVYGMKKIVKI